MKGLRYPKGKVDKTYCVPEGVEKICQYAFEGCKRLEEVIILDGVEVIEREAFLNCEVLRDIEISETVVDIFDNAFRNCQNLTIHAPSDSVAKQYADKHDIAFIQF